MSLGTLMEICQQNIGDGAWDIMHGENFVSYILYALTRTSVLVVCTAKVVQQSCVHIGCLSFVSF